MLFEFVLWWYGPGWLGAWENARRWVVKIQRMFAIPVLLASIFSPWRRIVSLPGRSIDEKFRAAIDNLISRTVGFFVRFIALLAGLVLMVLAGVAGLLLAITWPVWPLAIIYCLFKGFSG